MPLYRLAHARSGDKGDGSNVGLIAYDDRGFEILRREVTAERVKKHFGDIVRGDVDRYEVPNLRALNFILHDSLGGGGSASLRTDAQGKSHGMGLLMMEVHVPDDYVPPTVGMGGPEYPGAARR
ncbi:MAG: AtuA-related protein [Candidatus Polarisedimenticolia bacterium]